MENKITLIIPIYNRFEHIKIIFEALMKQTLKPNEVILSDDGSNSDILEYLKLNFIDFPFKLKCIYQKDLGFRKTRALNNAVKEASNDFLIFIDQDLIFGEDFIKNIYEAREKNKFIMLRPGNTDEREKNYIINDFKNSKYKEILKKISFMGKEISRLDYKRDIKNNFLYRLKLRDRGAKFVGMAYALYKEDYIRINGYDEKYQGWGYEDDDFGNRLYKAGLKSKPLYLEDIPIHLWHPFDPTKKKSVNEEYYYKRKKEISRKNYKCEYGYDKSLNSDTLNIKELN
jgi:GT2 family glycosyltransferase